MKVKGLDALVKTLETAQRAFREIDGELGTVSFDPEDPASIEAAIRDVEAMIDQRLGPYESNTIVGPMIGEMKAKYRQGIIDRAAEARLTGHEESDGQ